MLKIKDNSKTLTITESESISLFIKVCRPNDADGDDNEVVGNNCFFLGGGTKIFLGKKKNFFERGTAVCVTMHIVKW